MHTVQDKERKDVITQADVQVQGRSIESEARRRKGMSRGILRLESSAVRKEQWLPTHA